MAYYPNFSAPTIPLQTTPSNFPPAMQNVPVAPQAAPQHGFGVRPVASREEAMAIQTDFFGPGIIMPCLGQGVVWIKRFNPNTGASDLLEFVYAPPQVRQETEFVPMSMFRELFSKVEQLEKGVSGNVPSE